MNEPRIVTPQEAQEWINSDYWDGEPQQIDLAHTVATEPDRTRAAVVKALQDLAETNFYDGDSDRPCDGYYDLIDRAMTIENGADL